MLNCLPISDYNLTKFYILAKKDSGKGMNSQEFKLFLGYIADYVYSPSSYSEEPSKEAGDLFEASLLEKYTHVAISIIEKFGIETSSESPFAMQNYLSPQAYEGYVELVSNSGCWINKVIKY